MTDYLARVTKWLGYSIALVVIIAATLVSVGRLLTPYLNEHKPDFERWASQVLHVPVQIHEVHISWNGYVPQLTLDKVIILDKDSQQPAFDIHQIKLSLKIFDSLLKKLPVLSYIKLSGMDLTIHSKKSGEWNIQGFGNIAVSDAMFGGAHEANEMAAWIFTQPALALSDIRVTFYTESGVKKSIQLDELSLVNSSGKHVLSGKGVLLQDIPTGVEIALNWFGNRFDFDTISAKLYLYLEGISLTQWLKQQTWHHFQIKEGIGSAKIWATLTKGKLEEVQTQVQLYQLKLYSTLTRQTQLISRLNGHFGWKREGKNQVIAGDEILMDLPNHLWPMTSFSLTIPLEEASTLPASDNAVNLHHEKILLTAPSKLDTLGFDNQVAALEMVSKNDNPFSLKTSYIDLGDVVLFAMKSGLLPDEWQHNLMAINPKGAVTSLQIDYHDSIHPENNTFSGNFSQVSWEAWKSYPGVKAFSGIIAWDGKTGLLDVNTKNLQLLYQALYPQSLNLDAISGKIYVKKDKQDHWIWSTNNLSVVNSTLAAYTSLTIETAQYESPKVDIIANFNVKKAEKLVEYFPIKMADPELSRWILQAFRSGQFDAGKIVLQGSMKDFPWDQHNGKFMVKAHAKDMDFGFALGWPVMKHVQGTVQFIGSKMVVDIDSGILMDVPMKNIQGEIPYIGPKQPQRLEIRGVVDGDLAQALAIIQKSPLRVKLHKSIQSMQLSGPMQLKLRLDIPLKKPENTLVNGDLSVNQSTVSLPAWNVYLAQLKGQLYFTENTVKAEHITGTWWNEPVTFSAQTEPDKPLVNIQIQGQLSSATLQSLAKNTTISSFIEGSTSYQADLRMAWNQPSMLTIRSDLKGVTLSLPAGLGKTMDEVIPSSIVAELVPNKPLAVKWMYGTKLSATTIFKTTKAGTELYNAQFHLGNKGQAKFQMLPGIVISGEFDVFDWNIWKKYLSDLTTQKPSSSSYADHLRAIDLQAKKILGLFQPFTDVHMVLSKNPSEYSLKIDSTEMSGLITLPIKSDESPIKAQFGHLHLMPSADATEGLDPKSIPALSFVGDNVMLRDKKVGRVLFDVSPSKNGLSIDMLRVETGLFNFNAKGEWLSKNNKMETQLSGKLATKNVAEFLSYWGSPTVNPVGSSATALFDLAWSDVPYKPMISTMKGDINLSLTSGSIVNLDTATTAKMGFGRILNILSVESISRALTLNFSDLTEKGFAFDSMKGQFTLKDGSAYTEDASINGSVARIDMSGRLGFVAKDYDMQVTVTPHITGSVPVVAALAINPIAGVAAWFVEKIAGKAVSSATTHQYKITGTWDKPEWVEK